MNDQDRARPVSGEIMTGSPARPSPRREATDIADADYETVEPQASTQTMRFSENPAPNGMDSLKAGAAAAGDGSKHGGPLFWTFGLALVALAFWMSGGHALVAQYATLPPAEAGPALRISDVASRIEHHNGRDILFVDGHAENHGPSLRTLPAIEIAISGNDGATTRYFLGTNEASIRPGDRYSFSSRLEAPRNGVKSVSVTFSKDSR